MSVSVCPAMYFCMIIARISMLLWGNVWDYPVIVNLEIMFKSARGLCCYGNIPELEREMLAYSGSCCIIIIIIIIIIFISQNKSTEQKSIQHRQSRQEAQLSQRDRASALSVEIW